jgi:hypothetical protein
MIYRVSVSLTQYYYSARTMRLYLRCARRAGVAGTGSLLSSEHVAV